MKSIDTSAVVRILVDRSVIILNYRSGAAVIIIGILHIILLTDIHCVFLCKCSRFQGCLGIFVQVIIL